MLVDDLIRQVAVIFANSSTPAALAAKSPNSHALRNKSGPISPCPNGLTKIPSGRADSRERFALRIESGRARIGPEHP